MKTIEILTQEAIALLKALIETPSFSSEEDKTALLIENWFTQNGIPFQRENNNIWAFNQHFDESKPTLLLNSHHDTVKPNQGYTNNPFEAIAKDGKLFGLGSNDAGGCLVSLLATFVHFYGQENLPYNMVIVASAEEEISGKNGLNSVLKHLPELDCAIVGEPTLMQLAIA
ncbi:MAG: M20/M25/M40 family metallo-hydrolase, partial [Crocinitomicaceae bacterium]|nr:M20/M25/M40 family metallo-hydrolase [Crocinitomicaceae bacterium]